MKIIFAYILLSILHIHISWGFNQVEGRVDILGFSIILFFPANIHARHIRDYFSMPIYMCVGDLSKHAIWLLLSNNSLTTKVNILIFTILSHSFFTLLILS